MSYIALYRKWRPTHFEDVVEQEHVVKTLRYSVSTGRIAHAYLFCGTRGTGKTTMAHILSRAINCSNPKDGDPCNECEPCREILSGSCVDVLEIDAASNNSVDNVRSIRDEVIYMPTKVRYKVYIIDEVHMLSTGAFNALLKTLEEPPEHVVFILATTEPHKLPATILSRCQRFDFRRITQEGIVKQLSKIAEASATALDKDAARLIARISDGAMRDAISLLDQCTSLGSGKIEYEDVLSVVGIVNDEFMNDFVGSMLNKNTTAILDNVSRLVMDGRDIAHFVSDLVMYFRNLLICKSTHSRCENLADVTADTLDAMKRQSEGVSGDFIINCIIELSELESALKWASNKRVLLEVTLIKLCGSSSPDNSDIADRLSAIEKKISVLEGNAKGSMAATGSSNNTASSRTAAPIQINEPGKDIMHKAASLEAGELRQSKAAPSSPPSRSLEAGELQQPKAAPSSPPSRSQKADELKNWPEIMDSIKSARKMAVHSLLLNTKGAIVIDENTIGLLFKDSFFREQVSKKEHIEVIEGAASKIMGRTVKVKCINEEKFFNQHSGNKQDKKDDLLEKAKNIADKAGLPLEIIEE